MKEHLRCRNHHKHGGLRFSILLILVGLVFLTVNTGIIATDYKPLLSHWPIWLVFGGLFFLTECSWFMSICLLSVGTFFLIPEIGALNPALNIPPDFAHLYWPALLIVAGIYFILAKSFRPSWICGNHFHREFDKNTSTYHTEDGYVKISTGFDSRKHIFLDPVFKGGTIETGFGEVILDLRKTTLPEGKTVLKVNVSFGSAQIIVPTSWNVQVHGDSFFGTFNDQRISPSYNTEETRTLLIEGKCSFGECKLRD
jgi:predicted membrane protein